MDEMEIRQLIRDTGKKLLAAGLVLGTWGNISARMDVQRMVITPSGMDYLKIEPGDMAVVDLETGEWSGPRKPSTEAPLHSLIYKTRPEVGAVIHTHSVFASTVAACGKDIPAILEEIAQIVGGPVRVARYALPGTGELASNAVEALEDRNAVLLANHGVVAVGAGLDEAFLVCQVVEKAAMVLIYGTILGGVRVLPEGDVAEIRRLFTEKYLVGRTRGG